MEPTAIPCLVSLVISRCFAIDMTPSSRVVVGLYVYAMSAECPPISNVRLGSEAGIYSA